MKKYRLILSILCLVILSLVILSIKSKTKAYITSSGSGTVYGTFIHDSNYEYTFGLSFILDNDPNSSRLTCSDPTWMLNKSNIRDRTTDVDNPDVRGWVFDKAEWLTYSEYSHYMQYNTISQGYNEYTWSNAYDPVKSGVVIQGTQDGGSAIYTDDGVTYNRYRRALIIVYKRPLPSPSHWSSYIDSITGNTYSDNLTLWMQANQTVDIRSIGVDSRNFDEGQNSQYSENVVSNHIYVKSQESTPSIWLEAYTDARKSDSYYTWHDGHNTGNQYLSSMSVFYKYEYKNALNWNGIYVNGLGSSMVLKSLPDNEDLSFKFDHADKYGISLSHLYTQFSYSSKTYSTLKTDGTPPSGNNLRVINQYSDSFDVYIDNVTDSRSGVKSVVFNVTANGKTKKYEYPCKTSNSYYINVKTADFNNAANYSIEVDCSDNVLNVSKFYTTCGLSLPDLIVNTEVVGLTDDTVQTVLKLGQQYRFKSIVSNIGSNSGGFCCLDIMWNNKYVSNTYMGFIGSGQSYTPIYNTFTADASGIICYEGIVDKSNLCAESNEDNNTCTGYIKVENTNTPDLTSSIVVPSKIPVGVQYPITVTIYNNRPYPAYNFYASVYESYGSGNYQDEKFINLLDGNSSTVITFYRSENDVGSHNYCAMADSKDNVVEYDETNNKSIAYANVIDATPYNDTLQVTKYDYKQNDSTFWVKTDSIFEISTTSCNNAADNIYPTRTYVKFAKDNMYTDNSSFQYADVEGTYPGGSEFNTYFNYINIGDIAHRQNVGYYNQLRASQHFSAKVDGTSFTLYKGSMYIDPDYNIQLHSTGWNVSSGLTLNVDGKAPTASSVMTSIDSNNIINITAKGVTDNLGSGVNSVYAEFSTPNGAYTSTINLTNSNDVWSGIFDCTSFISQIQNCTITVYAKDNVGNISKFNTDPINIFKLYNFRVTDIKDPDWKETFYNDDGSCKNKEFFVNSLPIDSSNNAIYNNATVKKGYSFYFKVNSKGLNQDTDMIRITPKFYYYDSSTNERQEVDLYYEYQGNPFTKIGTSQDTCPMMLSLNEDYFDKSKLLNIGTYGLITLNKAERQDNGTEQIWTGKYSLPADAFCVKKGTIPRPENKLEGKNLIINFQIEAIRDSQVKVTYVPNQWQSEGGPKANNFIPGDVIVYDNSQSWLDDYDIYTVY